ncbi:MAG TPA: hypothetical protein V6C46_09035 [Coleofasciculaceae cyanobacterium]
MSFVAQIHGASGMATCDLYQRHINALICNLQATHTLVPASGQASGRQGGRLQARLLTHQRTRQGEYLPMNLVQDGAENNPMWLSCPLREQSHLLHGLPIPQGISDTNHLSSQQAHSVRGDVGSNQTQLLRGEK